MIKNKCFSVAAVVALSGGLPWVPGVAYCVSEVGNKTGL